jgi:sirohydrochlorin cobaltochelatase
LKEGIVLFAHGSRAPAWARPFKKIAAQLPKKYLVRVAYLELMRPSLGEAVKSLATAGVKKIRVVPLFLGSGGHVRHDLPRLAARARNAHPGLRLVVQKPIGEQSKIIRAIAEAIVAGRLR